MPDARMSTVAERVIVNGVPTAIHKFTVQEPPSQVRAFYKDRLGAKTVERRGARYITLGALLDQQFVTVRVSAGSGEQQTDGTIAIADFSHAINAALLPERVMAPMGARLVFSTDSKDLGLRSKLFIYVSRQTVDENTQMLKAETRKGGYQVKREETKAGPQEARVLLFEKKGGDLLASVTRDRNGTSLVLNFTSPDSTK